MFYIDSVDVMALYPGKLEFLNYELTSPSYNRFITTTDSDRKIVNRRATVGITNISIRIVMYDTKENSSIMASKIVSLLGEANVNFGGNVTYRVTVSTDGQFELLTENMFLYTLQVQVLEKKGPVVDISTTSAAALTISNTGTHKTPIIIQVTPTTTISSFSVYGFGLHTSANPLVVSNPIQDKITSIDGEQCMIMQETVGGYVNKFADSNLMSFPEIPVGDTELVFSPANLNIRVLYNPRYI